MCSILGFEWVICMLFPEFCYAAAVYVVIVFFLLLCCCYCCFSCVMLLSYVCVLVLGKSGRVGGNVLGLVESEGSCV